jgi:hypothetical protein
MNIAIDKNTADVLQALIAVIGMGIVWYFITKD